MFIIVIVVNRRKQSMNKKLIALFTGISLSALAVGVVSIVKQNKSTFVKTAATEKTFTLTSINTIEYDEDDLYKYGYGNISTGYDTYITTEVTIDNCVSNLNSGVATLSEGGANYGGYGALLEIKLGIRGLRSFRINASYTSLIEYEKEIFTGVFNSYWYDDSSIETYSTNDELNLLEFNKDVIVDDFFNTSQIKFTFQNFQTFNLTSIELTMSCETDE